jgi:hypothetical protein
MSISVSYRILDEYPNYLIRPNADVWSIERIDRFGRPKGGRYLKPKLTKYGYHELCMIDKNGKARTVKAHRIVAMAFIENPENKSQVNHIDGNKINNHAKNLEWVTPQENIDHGIKIGLIKNKHEMNPTSKLTKIKADDILFLYHSGAYSQRILGKMFGVSQRTIYDIIHGLKWA